MFFRFILCACAIVILLAGPPARASGGGDGHSAPKSEEGHGGESKKKDEGEPQAITGGRFDGDPIYVHMQPVILPIITERGVEQLVTMLVDLQTKDFDKATELHEHMPRLKDAVLGALYGGLSDGDLRRSNALDLERIKEEIKLHTNRLFGADSVLNVYIQAVAQRRL